MYRILFSLFFCVLNFLSFGQSDIFSRLEKQLEDAEFTLVRKSIGQNTGKDIQEVSYIFEILGEEGSFNRIHVLFGQEKSKASANEALEKLRRTAAIGYTGKVRNFDKGYLWDREPSLTFIAIQDKVYFSAYSRNKENAKKMIQEFEKFFGIGEKK